MATLVVLLVVSSTNFQPQTPNCDSFRANIEGGAHLERKIANFSTVPIISPHHRFTFSPFHFTHSLLTALMIGYRLKTKNFYQLTAKRQGRPTKVYAWIPSYKFDISADCLSTQSLPAAGGRLLEAEWSRAVWVAFLDMTGFPRLVLPRPTCYATRLPPLVHYPFPERSTTATVIILLLFFFLLQLKATPFFGGLSCCVNDQ